MSATKHLAKWLKTATPAEVAAHRDELAAAHKTERNPLVRSSIGQRLVMCDMHLRTVPSN